MTTPETYKGQPLPLHFEHKGKKYVGLARPLPHSSRNGFFTEWHIEIEDQLRGTIKFEDGSWIMENEDPELALRIGREIDAWFNAPPMWEHAH